MAVFTLIQECDAQAFVCRYMPGARLIALEPIAAGIENTNYHLHLLVAGEPHRLVLTIFEMLGAGELEPVLAFMHHLAAAGLPVPAPLPALDGDPIGELQGKPAVLVPFVSGCSVLEPSPEDCRVVARTLALIHRTGRQFSMRRPAVRNLHWLVATLDMLRSLLPAPERTLLENEVAIQEGYAAKWSTLPGGWGHQDLFRDNVLMDTGRITGVIDFYQACEEPYVLDLAVLINDWCVVSEHGFDLRRMGAVVAGYQDVRLLQPKERDLLPVALRLAALRFWLSRSVTWYGDGYQHEVKRGDVRKDPLEMARLCRFAAELPPIAFNE